jgi:DNA-directed RNA polymerase specialized sigma24 family protein
MQRSATTALTLAALPLFDDFYRDQFTSVAHTAALVARDPDRGLDLAQEAFARAFER